MTVTKWSTVLALVALSGTGSWALLSLGLDLGWAMPAAPVPVIAVIALLGLGVLAAAWPIRRWNSGRRDRPLDPLRAARTVALAKAATLTGSLMTGVWGGFAVIALPRTDIEAQADRAWAAALAVLVSLFLLAAGLLAERWCRIPPETEDDETVVDGSFA